LTRRDFVKAAAAVSALGFAGTVLVRVGAAEAQQMKQMGEAVARELKPLPDPTQWDSVKIAEPWFWHARDPRKNIVREYILVPTTCNNCEAQCGILAWIDKETLQIRKVTGNPLHPGSLGTTCAKGQAIVEQAYSIDRIYFPLKRVPGSRRGEMRWIRITWEQALKEIAESIRYVYEQYKRTGDERWLKTILFQQGRPNEGGLFGRLARTYGMDALINHTNQCSSSGRVAMIITSGADRPNSDFRKTRLIVMISAHLDGGHYFQQHAKRIIEGKQNGARIVTLDPRLSNTAAKSDVWIPVWPGTDTAVILSVIHEVLKRDKLVAPTVDWEFVKQWTNWYDLLEDRALLEELQRKGFIKTLPPTPEELRRMDERERFEWFKRVIYELYGVWDEDPDHHYSVDWAAAEALGPRELYPYWDDATYSKMLEEFKYRIRRFAELVVWAGNRITSWMWRSVGAGNLGGVMAMRAMYLLHILMGAFGREGAVYPAKWSKPPNHAAAFDYATGVKVPPPKVWNEYTYPPEYPIAKNEVNIITFQLLLDDEWRRFWEERGFKIPDHLELYFSFRIFNGARTLPAGFFQVKAFLEGERKEGEEYVYDKVRTVVVADPHWSEQAQFADYILPVGTVFERTDTASHPTFKGAFVSVRTSVYRTALELMGRLNEYLADWKEPTPEDFKAGRAVPPSVVLHRKLGIGEICDWDEMWIYLWWYVDPDNELGIRKAYESRKRPGRPLSVDEVLGAHYDVFAKHKAYKRFHVADGLKKFAERIGKNPNDEDQLREATAFYAKRYGVFFPYGEPQPLKQGGL